MDPTPEEVSAVLARVPVDRLQFHGAESPEFCASFFRPYLKAIPMRPGVNVMHAAWEYSSAQGLLVDAYRPGIPGGTGESFDWDRIPVERTRPLILAGGLHPGNVTEAVRRVHPDAVDVSSGVESAKGIKDPARMAAFVRAVRCADD